MVVGALDEGGSRPPGVPGTIGALLMDGVPPIVGMLPIGGVAGISGIKTTGAPTSTS